MATAALGADVEINPSVKKGTPLQKIVVQKDPGNWRRDPFQLLNNKSSAQYPHAGFSLVKHAAPSVEKKVALEPIRLQGIMQVESSSYALVNARVLKVGDSIAEGFVVNEIGKYHIVVKENGSLHSYNIFQGKLK